MSEEIKVGSQVIVHSRNRHNTVEKVMRETKLYWVIGRNELKYKKSDLHKVGSDHWYANKISAATPEKIKEVERLELGEKLSFKLKKLDFSTLSLADLQVISEILDKKENDGKR